MKRIAEYHGTRGSSRDKWAAVVTIKDAEKMTKRGRRSVAAWLRKQAAFLEREGHRFASTFRGRYLYRT